MDLCRTVPGKALNCNSLETRQRGPFLWSLADFKGPKSYLKIKLKNRGRLWHPSHVVHFVSLAASLPMQFLNLLKPHFEWKQISFTGPICHRDLRETDPVPLNHYNQPLITKKSIARWHARLKNSWQLFSRAEKHEWPMWSWCYLNFGCRGGAANHLIGAAKYLFASIQNDNSTLPWENLYQYHNSIQITQGTRVRKVELTSFGQEMIPASEKKLETCLSARPHTPITNASN